MQNLNTENKSFGTLHGMPTVAVGPSKSLIHTTASHNVVVLWGGAGIGKTAMAHQTGDAINASVYVYTMSQEDEASFGIPQRPTEGVPYFEVLPPKKLYNAVQEAKSGKSVILFLDEINRADKATLAVAWSLIGDRTLNGEKLPDNLYVMCACNPDDGNYETIDMLSDPAWRRRGCHFWVEHTLGGWLRYARAEGMSEEVISFIEINPEALLDEKARAAKKLYPTPASWHKVSNLLKVSGETAGMVEPAIASIIGSDHAAAFCDWSRNKEYSVHPMDVLTKFSKVKPVIEKMKKDGRSDVVTRTVNSVGRYLSATDNWQPDKFATGFIKLAAMLTEETKHLLVKHLIGMTTGGDATHRKRHDELTTAINTHHPKEWRELYATIEQIKKAGRNF